MISNDDIPIKQLCVNNGGGGGVWCGGWDCSREDVISNDNIPFKQLCVNNGGGRGWCGGLGLFQGGCDIKLSFHFPVTSCR